MLTVFVGDVTGGLSKSAKQHDPAAYLITSTNVYDSHSGTVYVSLGDLNNVKELVCILTQASKINYVGPPVWSDKKTHINNYSMAWITANYVNLVSRLYSIPVEGCPEIEINIDVPNRASQESQLWIVGCSTTNGTGVNVEERYGNLVASAINTPVTTLAEGGSSIQWASDQIIRANIKPGDIVIWGLTTVSRLTWFDGEFHHISAGYYQDHPEFNNIVNLNTLDSVHRLYEALTAIGRVENFCKISGARLLLVGIHVGVELSSRLAGKEHFLMIHGISSIDWASEFLDYGTDNSHPGVLTHKMYSEKILNKIKELGW
jgi:hypothetical protein